MLTKFIVVFLTVLNYPALAEKATPENEVAIVLIRVLHPAGTERFDLFCPDHECKLARTVKDVESGTAKMTRARATQFVRKFLRSVPKGDVKKGVGKPPSSVTPEMAYLWYVAGEKQYAEGHILQSEVQAASKEKSARVGAIGALEFRLLSLLKTK